MKYSRWALACFVLLLSSVRSFSETVPGTVEGQLNVNLTGSAAYTIPLDLPSGAAGMTPKLLLTYDSNSGPGQVGLGWSIAGISAITRINRTYFIDKRPGVVDFDDPSDGYPSDALSLDGARLVRAPEGGAFLAKSIDDQTRVWPNGAGFTAKTKAGLTLHFGEGTSSRILTAGGKVKTWALSRIEDTFGNQIVFIYLQRDGDWGVTKIFWTVPKGSLSPADLYDESLLRANAHARLEVAYESGTAVYSIGYLGGEKSSRSLLAKQIVSFVGSSEFRRYEFGYEPIARFGGRRLVSIEEFAAEVGGPRLAYPKSTFTYTDFNPQWNQSSGYELPADFGSYRSLKSGYRMVDLDGDGDRDLLYSAYVDGRSFRRAFRQEAQQWVAFGNLTPPLDFSADTDETDAVFFFDTDGDKKPELFSSKKISGKHLASAHVQDNENWKDAEDLAPPFVLVEERNRVLRTLATVWEGKSRLLAWDVQGGVKAWTVEQGKWTESEVSGYPDTTMPSDIFDGDFDCDGKADVATVSFDKRSVRFMRKDSGGQLELKPLALFDAANEIAAVKQVTNGGCSNLALVMLTKPGISIIGVGTGGTIVERVLPAPESQLSDFKDVFPIDLEGQGEQSVALLLDRGTVGPNITFYRFDPGSKDWNYDPALDYVPSSAESVIDEAYLVAVEDVNDDKRDDFLLLPGQSGITTKALVNDGGVTFKMAVPAVPPIEFAREEKAGASPQFVDLNADGLTDVVGYHVDKDNNQVLNTAQVNTSSGWIGVDGLKLPKPLTHEKGGASGAFVDFNSDGIADFIYAYGDPKDWGAWTIRFDNEGNATAWVPTPGYALPAEARLSDQEAGDLGVRFMDLNGDGRVDIVIARYEANRSFFRRAFLNTGTGWTAAPTAFLPPVPFVSRNRAEIWYETKVLQGDYYRDLRISTGDVNGDGLTDILFRYGHLAKSGTGALFSATPGKAWCLNKDKTVPAEKPGLPAEIIPHPIPTATECAGLYLSTGNGWRAAADPYFPPIKLDVSIREENASVDVADINGDGLLDIVPARLVGSTNAYPAYLNTGSSWAADANFAVPSGALSADKKLTSHRIMDINGDGLLDIAYHRPGPQRGSFVNTGTGWLQAVDSFAPPDAFINEKGEDQGVRLIDVDGNGLPDALRSYRNKAGDLIQTAYLNTGDPSLPSQAVESRADMLKSVANGMGLVTTLNYRSLISPRISALISEDDFYTPSPIPQFPTISHVPTMYAVQQMAYIDSDGSEIATQYKYKGFRFDVPAATVLGFEERTARNFVNGVASGVVETVELYQDYFRNGRSRREAAVIDQVAVSEIINTYQVVETAAASWPKRLVLNSTVTANHDLNGKSTGLTTQKFVYDVHDNASQTCVEYGDGSRTLTKNIYDNSPDLVAPDVLFLGRLVQAEISQFRTTAPVACDDLLEGATGVLPSEVVTNSAGFTYDIKRDAKGKFDPTSTGILKQEIANLGHPLAVTKSYEHDRFGNVITETATTKDLPARRTLTQYDPMGRFKISETNALGHRVTYEHSSLLGVAIKMTDANDVSAESQYDGFGRLTATISPTGLKSADLQRFTSGPNVSGREVAFEQIQKVGDLPEIKSYFDYQGRVLRTEKAGKSKGAIRRVFQDSKYDARGRASAITLPYFEGETVYEGVTEFDNLDRPTRTIAPDGAVTQTIYDGLLTTLKDANGKLLIKRVNEKGLTVETTDNLKGLLRFEYGAGDRVLRTVQPDGLVLVHEYDQVGNKVRSSDPDLGRWEYAFNGFGEIVWQRDAKGQITTVEYDLLGRPTYRHMPDKLDEFTYDKAAFGVGKPSAVSSSDGYEERFTYDGKGRLSRKATRVTGELFSTSVTYDRYDRIVQTYYPGNYVVTNEYDEFGYLSQVRANDPLKPFGDQHKTFWQAGERDQYGRIVSERLGNGATSIYTFDPLKGNLSHISSGTDDENIADIHLEYDLVGNLLSKDHRTEKRKEEFSYDGLDRLVEWTVNGKAKGTYTYDAAGRMLSKTGMGRYIYAGDGPAHGVKRVERPDGSEGEYRYDANGNMVFSPKGLFEYYANNSVRLIYKSKDAWSRFSYAPDGSRYLQHYSENRQVGKNRFVSNVLQTVSVGAYEQIRDLGGAFIVKPGGYQRHRLYLSAEGGVVAVLEHSTEFDPLVSDPDFRARNADKPIATAIVSVSEHYLHKDELGSVLKVTDQMGNVVSGYSYDPWGKKTQIAWADKGKQDFSEGTFHRGFTGHEHLDNLDLIHMNGRVYDPDLARFVSADPTLQFPLASQNYDRYSYVGNNPLKFTDPTGFSWLGKVLGKAWNAFTRPFKEAWRFLEKNWRTVVVITVSAVITVATGGVGGIILAGAISGGLSAALYGGTISDVLAGAVKGAVFAAVSAGFGGALGADVAAAYGNTAGYVAGAAGAGLASGVQTYMSGGNFWAGFASGALMKALAGPLQSNTRGIGTTLSMAALGGTTSVIGGGKFANGAVFAAYGSILSNSLNEGMKAGRSIASSLVDAGREILDTFTKLSTSAYNTAVGLAWGGLGWAFGGSAPTFEHNAIVFRNHPFMKTRWISGAITLGNTISAVEGFDDWSHEKVHTYQSQAMGVFYFPANVAGMIASGLTLGAGRSGYHGGDIFHGRANVMEGSPFSNRLYGD
ncbi:hypothetical protein EHS39_16420 [Ensifer sp. MPMI2T]|nr:hypothetical protein EHS39_16420 [Ensifer sp. MPMI2T]